MEAYCAGENIQVLENSAMEGGFLAPCPRAGTHCIQSYSPVIQEVTKHKYLNQSMEVFLHMLLKNYPPNLLKPKVHYRLNKFLPRACIQSKMNPVHALTHSLKAHFNLLAPE